MQKLRAKSIFYDILPEFYEKLKRSKNYNITRIAIRDDECENNVTVYEQKSVGNTYRKARQTVDEKTGDRL